MNFTLSTYRRFPIEFISGLGVTLTDREGKKYIDLLSGLGVNNLGYCHLIVEKAIIKAVQTPLHVSNLFYITPQEKLAEMIGGLSFSGKAFFSNSGSEANETAIKFLLKKATLQNIKNPVIFSAKRSFHGRTIGSLSATGQKKYRQNFSPLLKNFIFFNINDDPSSLKSLFEKYRDRIIGTLIEVIQGEGGVYPIDKKQFNALKKLSKEYNSLLFIDEIQSGCFRTGKFLSFQHYTRKVDGFTLAKSLGGGLPIGCFFVSKKYEHIFTPGDHASTFGGNPFVTSVALSVLSFLANPTFLKNLDRNIYSLRIGLNELQFRFNWIRDIRGIGMMMALEIDPKISADRIVKECLRKGIILNSINDNIVRLLPPLIISKEEIDKSLEIIKSVFQNHAIK